MTLILLYLLGALGVSFLCSVLEAVLLSTPVSFISMKESQGIKAASLLMKYKTNIDRPVAAILTLNTVTHTIGAAGVGSESVKVFGEACFGIISAILTLLILVLSEIIPKTIGASYWRTLVGTDDGVIEDAENKVIQNFLKLSNVKAEDIMTPYVVVASASTNTTMKEFYDNKTLAPFSRIPVFETSREFIVGYVRRANVLEMLTQDKFTVPLQNIVRPIPFFMENTKVSDIWQRMLQEKEHISVITDEYGCMRGIVTMEDVIETMLGVEIVDECDTTDNLQAMARKKFTPEAVRYSVGDHA